MQTGVLRDDLADSAVVDAADAAGSSAPPPAAPCGEDVVPGADEATHTLSLDEVSEDLKDNIEVCHLPEISPGLFLGNADAASNLSWLEVHLFVRLSCERF